MKLKEWHRTVILVTLLAIAVAYIIYLKTGYQSHIDDILR